MNAYFLDTSALLAHYRQETGALRVQTILEEDGADIFISALSVAEFARRVVTLGIDVPIARSLALDYANLATSIVSVDTATAIRAFEIGTVSQTRLPLVDALIAAGAAVSGAILVHRDPHFNEIPEGLLKREDLTHLPESLR